MVALRSAFEDPAAPRPVGPSIGPSGGPSVGPSGGSGAEPAPPAAASVLARAIDHRDEHVITFADTALESFDRTRDRCALQAAVHIAGLIRLG